MGTKISEIADQIDSSNLQDAKFVVEDNLTTKYVTGSQLQSFIGAGGPHLYPMYRYKYEPDMSVATTGLSSSFRFSTWVKDNWENHGQQAPPGIYTWKYRRNHYGQSASVSEDLTMDVTTQFPTEPIIKETGNESSAGPDVKGRGTLKYGLAYYQGKLFILVATTGQGKGIQYDGSGPRWLTYLPANTNPNPRIDGLDIAARVAVTYTSGFGSDNGGLQSYDGTEIVDRPTNYNVTSVSSTTRQTGSGNNRSYYRDVVITFQTPLARLSWFIINGSSEPPVWSATLASDGMSATFTSGGYATNTAGGGFNGIRYRNFADGDEILFIK